MLRRANDLVERARERIRLAAERDPHAWNDRDDDRAILVHDDQPEAADETPAPHDEQIAGAAPRPATGSPEPGAPDVDNAPGVSGPPEGGGDATTSGRRPRQLPG